MSKTRGVALALVLALCPALILEGCGKARPGAPEASASGSPDRAGRSSGKKGAGAAILTKEEVGAVLGQPVTSVEGQGTDLTYKTAVMQLEAGIEVEQMNDVADAVQSMEGARKATGFLGGTPEVVPGLGDEAIFGAMSTLYVRKGSVFFHIQPPNLQQVAGLKVAERMRKAPLGSDEQIKALEELQQVQKGDPMAAGLKSADAMQGALATIKASSQKQGTQYETDTRAMAQALATKLLEKL